MRRLKNSWKKLRQVDFIKTNKFIIKSRIKILLYVIISLLGIILAYKTYGISLVLLISMLFIKDEKEKLEIIAQGEVGEKVTEKVLEKLPRKYQVLNNKKVYKPRGYNQLDHIVIGPNGVFIVETKYHKGIISGNDDDFKVLQRKKTPSGKIYSSRFLNPTKQVQTHVRTVVRKLKSLGYEDTSVVGIVYFSHPDAKVRLKSKKNAIFSSKKNGGKKLRRYVRGYRGYKRLSRKDVNIIAKNI